MSPVPSEMIVHSFMLKHKGCLDLNINSVIFQMPLKMQCGHTIHITWPEITKKGKILNFVNKFCKCFLTETKSKIERVFNNNAFRTELTPGKGGANAS